MPKPVYRCDICAGVEPWPSRGSHCTGCHHTWTAGNALHCSVCHNHFGGESSFKAHLRAYDEGERIVHRDPGSIMDKYDEPRFVLNDRGTWVVPMTEEALQARTGR